MPWPCETRTSTCRSFVKISSGLCLFLGISVLLDAKRHTSSRTTSSRADQVELEFSPIACDPELLSCHCGLPGPLELGAVNPYAVHDHGQPARQHHDRLLHPAVPGDLHGPGFEPG